MKKLLWMVALVGLLAPPLAGAQGWGFGPVLQAQGPMKKGEPPRGGQLPPPRDPRRQGRMSDEERRGLHQDLDRANREIYKPAPKR